MELSRCHYIIMGILRSKKATNKIRGLTINEINALEKTSKSNTIYVKLKQLVSIGFVAQGVKAGKAETYYLTEQGLNELPNKDGGTENEQQ